MSVNHTINVSDLTDCDAVLRVVQEIPKSQACGALMQNGVEIAKIFPVRKSDMPNEMVSEKLTQKRLLSSMNFNTSACLIHHSHLSFKRFGIHFL